MGHDRSPVGVVDAGVCHAAAPEEQAWLAEVLGEPVPERRLRVWIYRRPALVLGSASRGAAAQGPGPAAAGLDRCVRPSGGGAVLAGPWLLGTSVVLPAHDRLVAASIPSSFRWFGLAHAAWLQGLGIDCSATPTAVRTSGDDLRWSCFASLSHWEVEAQGRKIVGLAQARRRNAVLFSSGTLIEAPPWGVLCDALGKPGAHARALAEQTVSCTESLGRPVSAQHLAASLLQHLSSLLSADDSPQ